MYVILSQHIFSKHFSDIYIYICIYILESLKGICKLSNKKLYVDMLNKSHLNNFKSIDSGRAG